MIAKQQMLPTGAPWMLMAAVPTSTQLTAIFTTPPTAVLTMGRRSFPLACRMALHIMDMQTKNDATASSFKRPGPAGLLPQ